MTKTFTVVALADEGDMVWYVDDEEVQVGGAAYDYTAPTDGSIRRVLTVRIAVALGELSYTWNITHRADRAAGSPNNPHVPDGPGPWFEGWYTRVSDAGGSRSIAVIGASSLPKGEGFTPGQPLPGYINVLISEGDGRPTVSYTVFPDNTVSRVGGEPVSSNPIPFSPADFEWVAEGFGTITQDRVDITIPGVLALHIQTENRLPFNVHNPEWGPYGVLDLFPLPLRWWIHSLGSDARYRYTLLDTEDPQEISGIGYAHLEKNWGAAFPIGWVWTQGIAAHNEAQFVMSTAEVDLGLFVLSAWIAAFRSPLVSWDFIFSMPAAVVYTERDACEGTFLFEITDPTRTLLFDASAPPDSFGPVSSPSEDGFQPDNGIESFSATVRVSAHEGGVLLDERVFTNAALEFGAEFTCPEPRKASR